MNADTTEEEALQEIEDAMNCPHLDPFGIVDALNKAEYRMLMAQRRNNGMAAPIQMFEAQDGTVFKNHIDAVTHDREMDLKNAQEGVEQTAETLVATLYSPCVLDEPEKSRRTTLEEATGLIKQYVEALQLLDDAKAAFNEPIAPIVAPAPAYVAPAPAPMPAPTPPANYEGLANDTMDRDVQLDEEDVQKKPRVGIRAALDARRARIQPPASVIRDDGMPETEDEELNENDILDAIM